MKNSLLRVMAVTALATSLMSCHLREAPFEVTSQTPAQPGMSLDPSVPDAATAFAANAAADKTVAAQTIAVPPKTVIVGKTMTKEEESKAMPMPGQANDHSTPGPKGK